jgi:hypothetical protein
MKRIPVLLGAAVLAAACTSPVLAQPAGSVLVTSAFDQNLVMSPGTYVIAEYYCTNDLHTGPYTVNGLTFTNNEERPGNANETGNLNTPTFGPDADDASLLTISEGEQWSAAGMDFTYPTEAGHSYVLELLFHDNFYPSPGSRAFNVEAGAPTATAVVVPSMDLAGLGAGKWDAADLLARCVLTNSDGSGFRVILRSLAINNPLICAAALLDITGVTPVVATPAAQQYGFIGHNVAFNCFGASDTPVSFQWQAGTTGSQTYTNLSDGGNLWGSATTNLVITNLTLTQSLDYVLVASNTEGSTTSTVVTLNVLAPPVVITPGPNYAYAIITNKAVDYWRLNDPNGSALAYDSGPGGKDGTVGANLMYSLAQAGPAPSDFPAFEANNGCMLTYGAYANDYITTPPLNLNTNTVTLLVWLNPNANQQAGAGILLARLGSGNPATGLAYGITPQANGDYSLRYFWNGVSADSGVQVPQNIWSLVGLVVTPTNQTIYVINTNGMTAWSAVSTNAVCPFSSPFLIGNDTATNGGYRNYAGYMDEPAVFNKALTTSQVLGLFTNASGVATIPPNATGPTAYTIVNPGVPVSLTGGAGGSPLPSLQWMMRPLGSGSYANVANAGGISGAQTATLTISSASSANSGDYVLVASNKVGTATSASGRLLVAQSNPPALIGQWVTGNQNDLQDKAGYYPAGLHDGYVEGSGTPTWVQGDVPPNFNSSLYSLVLDGASAVAITNTSQNSTLYTGEFNDTDYRIDYDNNVTNRFSVACWAKGFPSTAWSPFIGKNCESGHGWAMRHNASGAGVPTFSASSLPDSDVGNGSSARDEDLNWHHWCGTYDSSTGFRHLYMDGVDVLDCPGGFAGIVPANGYHMMFGNEENPTLLARYFTGSLFDVRFYNYAVTPAEVQAMMIPGSTGAVGLYLDSTAANPIGRPVTFTVLIPMGANATGPVTVWVTNVNPSVVSIAGAPGNVFSLTFPAGAYPSEQLTLTGLSDGQATISVGGSSGSGFTSASATVRVYAPNHMVGHWLVGATNLTEYSGFMPAGTHDGTFVGTVPATLGVIFTNDVPAGFPGRSILFNSAYAVRVNNSSATDAGYQSSFDDVMAHKFTVTFWTKTADQANWVAWMAKRGDDGLGFQIRRYNSKKEDFSLRETQLHSYTQGNSAFEDMLTTSTKLYDSKWHLCAAIWDGYNGTRQFLVDGVLDPGMSETGDYATFALARNHHLVIGSEENTTVGSTWVNQNGYLNGMMYDVRIFNYPLTALQVSALMTPPTGPHLTAQLVAGQVQLSWSAAYPGYVVQTAPAVKTSGTVWSTPSLTVTLQNGQYTATDSAPGASPKFYRLSIQE